MNEEIQKAIETIIGADLIVIRQQSPFVLESHLAPYVREIADNGVIEIVDEDEYQIIYKRVA